MILNKGEELNMRKTIGVRIAHAWNAFRGREPTDYYRDLGSGTSVRPDRGLFMMSTEQSIVTSIYNRISIDVAALSLKHVRLDDNERYVETLNSGLNKALNVEANVDQTGKAFIQDIVMSTFDEGAVAIVPVETTFNPAISGNYEIKTLRVGEILEWYPKHLRVRLYNEDTGLPEELILEKKYVAVVENPLYAVMNEPNSILQRLIRKITLLDTIDEASGSGKLDIIIQLPYVIRSKMRREQAEQRKKDLELQLTGSKYGIAYTDGTEKITQLNRPAENNLMAQIEYLTSMLYSQLGLTESIFDGTADEKTMLNYYNRTVEPVTAAITGEMTRKFLTKTARSQGQSVEYFRDPFKLVPVEQLADIADKFTRNEIMSSNDVRAVIGMKPSDDPRAEELRNKNLNASGDEVIPTVTKNLKQ